MKRIFCGVDFSITCPGFHIFDMKKQYQKFQFGIAFPFNKPNKFWNSEEKIIQLDNFLLIGKDIEYSNQTERFFTLCSSIAKLLVGYGVEEIAIEDYALGAKGKVFSIAECTGLFKSMMQNIFDIPVYAYPPTQIKKFFSGKGNTNKIGMSEAFNQICGFKVHEKLNCKEGDNPASDIIDAYAVLMYHLNKQYQINLLQQKNKEEIV